MANDNTPKDNQENAQHQVEETQVNSSSDESEGLGKLYDDNKMMILGVLAIGIAVAVFMFMSNKNTADELANSLSAGGSGEFGEAYANDSTLTNASKVAGYFNAIPAGIENAPEESAQLLAATREFDNGNFEEALSFLNQWDAPEGYSWIQHSLEGDIVSSQGDMESAGKLYDEAIANAPSDRPKILLSLLLKDALYHIHMNDMPSAHSRCQEINAFPDHHLYLQYDAGGRVAEYSIDGLLNYTK
ncbi:MAG: tetratricopeptide repeat protein [Bacteroidota bacterium]|nr:tetratricopeptide repeat protein [Bacteroidota bacterium]